MIHKRFLQSTVKVIAKTQKYYYPNFVFNYQNPTERRTSMTILIPSLSYANAEPIFQKKLKYPRSNPYQ